MDNNEIRREMELEQKRAFCKQSCTKIDQGLAKLDPRSGERAIWELFQNARDQAQPDSDGQKKAYIKITLTPSEFIFAHQGRPFDPDALTSLVMQVSSQAKENDETVGQYGTGFLTTHVFGRKLYVTGSLDMGKYSQDSYVDINRFVIDRTYDNITEFVGKVAQQLLAVSDYADVEKTASCRAWTQLSYDLSSMEGAAENAASAIEASVKMIPYVMTVNKPIVSVTLENQMTGEVYEFRKTQQPDEAGLKVMSVTTSKNGVTDEQKIYYLESADGEDIAILPLSSPTTSRSLQGIAKLFVFFPLLGTEDFGMDVVFHSKKFFPVEERDGLHLPVTNANVRSKYEQNVRVLNQLTEMVHAYYRSHAEEITGWVNVSGLTFDCDHHKEDVTKKFFSDFKQKWSNFFRQLPMIDLNGSRISLDNSNVKFFSPTIVEDLEDDADGASSRFDAVYNAAAVFNELVSRDEILVWSNVVASWDASHRSLLDVNDIAKGIGEVETVPVGTLLEFDSYLSEKKLVSLFSTYALIPNRDGQKRKMSDLRDASTIPGWLGEISKKLAEDKVQLFADDSFTHLVNLTTFTRNDLRDAITSGLKPLRQNFLDKGDVYDSTIMETLLKLSSIFVSDTSSMIRRNAIGIIAAHIEKEVEVRTLPPLDSNEREIAELPFKHLVECMLLEISQKDSEWVSENMDYVVSLHSALSSWPEYYNRNNKEGLCTKYGAFPNRNGEPCTSRDLEKGEENLDQLDQLYQDVMEKNLNSRLLDQRFESFCDFPALTAKAVACEIETRLEDDGFSHSSVLDIINNLKDGSEWNQWFPHIAAKKAELFLGRVQDNCKESIFKLMKINDSDKLAQLAALADDGNLDEIIERGRAAMIECKNREADFNFKLALGKYVEEIIKRNLSEMVSAPCITVETEQYGSDLSICKNGEPIYYIEVKSRWGTSQSVNMTSLQMQTSVEESDNYALCCVDMSKYGFSDVEEHRYPALEELLPHIKVLTNIGSLNTEIAQIATGSDNRPVYIGGDYKCVVPQSTIQAQGKSFNSMLEDILNKI